MHAKLQNERLRLDRALAAQGALRIPVPRRLGEPFERRAFKVRKFRAPRPPPVPARDPERAIHMLLSKPEHRSSEACISDGSLSTS